MASGMRSGLPVPGVHVTCRLGSGVYYFGLLFYLMQLSID